MKSVFNIKMIYILLFGLVLLTFNVSSFAFTVTPNIIQNQIDNGKAPLALKELKKISKRMPNSSKVFFLEAEAYNSLNLTAQAKTSLIKAEKIEPNMPYANKIRLHELEKHLGVKNYKNQVSTQKNENVALHLALFIGLGLALLLTTFFFLKKRSINEKKNDLTKQINDKLVYLSNKQQSLNDQMLKAQANNEDYELLSKNLKVISNGILIGNGFLPIKTLKDENAINDWLINPYGVTNMDDASSPMYDGNHKDDADSVFNYKQTTGGQLFRTTNIDDNNRAVARPDLYIAPQQSLSSSLENGIGLGIGIGLGESLFSGGLGNNNNQETIMVDPVSDTETTQQSDSSLGNGSNNGSQSGNSFGNNSNDGLTSGNDTGFGNSSNDGLITGNDNSAGNSSNNGLSSGSGSSGGGSGGSGGGGGSS